MSRAPVSRLKKSFSNYFLNQLYQFRTESGVTSRADFVRNLSFTAASLAILPKPASAAKYGGFGAGSPEVIDPKSAIVDEEILATDAVQKSLAGIKSYVSSVKSMQATLSSDGQADIGSTIRKDFDFVQLRTTLNTLNSAFDEDTQRGTDRIIRIILQDITELEASNKVKEGGVRSERRLGIMNGKLAKLEKAFNDLLAFV